MVKVIEAEKGLNLFYGIRGFLIADSFHLFSINFNFFYNDDKPKVFYIFYPKFAFFNINL